MRLELDFDFAWQSLVDPGLCSHTSPQTAGCPTCQIDEMIYTRVFVGDREMACAASARSDGKQGTETVAGDGEGYYSYTCLQVHRTGRYGADGATEARNSC